MKKTLLLLSLIGLVGSSFAQSAKLGISAGLNQSSMSSTSNGSTQGTSSLTGFHAGVFADFGLGSISIQPGIYYSTKGAKDDESGTQVSGSTTYTYHGTATVKLNYIEVPVNVLYHVPVVAGDIFVGGGPYVAMGISGKSDASLTLTGGGVTSSASQSSTVTFGSGSNDVKNPDYGINLLGGIQLKNHILFSVGYGFGLANLDNTSGSTTKNNVFRLSVGYSFL